MRLPTQPWSTSEIPTGPSLCRSTVTAVTFPRIPNKVVPSLSPRRQQSEIPRSMSIAALINLPGFQVSLRLKASISACRRTLFSTTAVHRELRLLTDRIVTKRIKNRHAFPWARVFTCQARALLAITCCCLAHYFLPPTLYKYRFERRYRCPSLIAGVALKSDSSAANLFCDRILNSGFAAITSTPLHRVGT